MNIKKTILGILATIVAGVVTDGEELLDFETGLQNIQRRNEA